MKADGENCVVEVGPISNATKPNAGMTSRSSLQLDSPGITLTLAKDCANVALPRQGGGVPGGRIELPTKGL